MDSSFQVYLQIVSKIVYIISTFFIIGGTAMILQSATKLHTSASEEDTKTLALFNIKVAVIAIIISVIAINYLGDYINQASVDYI